MQILIFSTKDVHIRPSSCGRRQTVCGLTHTGPIGRQLKARGALAAVAAWNVDTVGIALAQVVPAVAFINICTGGREKERTSITSSIAVWLEHAGGCGQQDKKKHNSSILALLQFRLSLAGSG